MVLDKNHSLYQIEFLNLVKDLRYIDSVEINHELHNTTAKIKLLGRFSKYFESDMQREKVK